MAVNENKDSRRLKKLLENLKEKEISREQAYKDAGMAVRSEVHFASLKIEANVDALFRGFFDFKEGDKLDLNFDKQIKFLKKISNNTNESTKDPDYLDAFRIIRNKFIHHLDINSYTACYASLGGQRAMVMKVVDEELEMLDVKVKGTEEERLQLGTTILVNRALSICDRLANIYRDREQKRVVGEITLRTHRVVQKSMLEPFAVAGRDIISGTQETYTKEEVAKLIHKCYVAFAKWYEVNGNKERDAYFKELGLTPPPIS